MWLSSHKKKCPQHLRCVFVCANVCQCKDGDTYARLPSNSVCVCSLFSSALCKPLPPLSFFFPSFGTSDTLVHLEFFFFFPALLCHDQFTARHMTACSASEDLKDFLWAIPQPASLFFSLSLPHNKTGICILIPLWPAERDRVPAFCLFPVIVCKGGLAPNLPQTVTKWPLLHPFLYPLCFQLFEVLLVLNISMIHVQAWGEDKVARHFANITVNQGSFGQGPREIQPVALNSDKSGKRRQ